ncbi:U4/U6.U5 small nuclear ribonucleoprotein 27 kDa protein isoform X2 [Coturnix japonica]|uniref:U4/U6.U5 small nuclear ribonucleoprotein 27 kDa protein isoform X2 n=1 Tax=Coturnix japonica TaxID=93934 RepID=UPI000776D891|nr:U4/U6.U5 small nuclear ribonucleoprotein 27 kDa protein isoform X2 [Coturnix japonica]
MRLRKGFGAPSRCWTMPEAPAALGAVGLGCRLVLGALCNACLYIINPMFGPSVLRVHGGMRVRPRALLQAERGRPKGGTKRLLPPPDHFGGGTKALRCCFRPESGERGPERRKWGGGEGGSGGRRHGPQPVPFAAASRSPPISIRFSGPGQEEEGTDTIPGPGQEENEIPVPASAEIQVPPPGGTTPARPPR